MTTSFILTLVCADRIGIVHAVSGFLADRGGNITEAAQFNDQSTGQFFMRMKFDVPELRVPELRDEFGKLATDQQFGWTLHAATSRMRTIVMVSRLGHCLNDLLFRYRSEMIPIDIRAIVSNHQDHAQLAAAYAIPFLYIPVTTQNKPQAEKQLLTLVKREDVELVVLARYMQVFSDSLCRALSGRAINIHHSFLPGFKGAKPYSQAYARGVKIIGATAHYVTGELDEGPIIEQDIARVDHSNDPEQLTHIGRDIESNVLSKAVTWHAQHRVLMNGTKTVVFK
jgi:formyltetrahydrofolate deformylase